MAAEILRRGVHDEVHTPLERPRVVRGGKRGIDDGLHAMLAPDRREAPEIEDAIVGIGWRLAHEHAGRRLDRVFQRFVVARGDGGHLDAVAGQHAVEELARVPVAVVGDDDVSTAREQREERGRHGAHAAREQEAVAGALERGELRLRDALRRVTVPAVADALVEFAVEVVLHFLARRPRIRRRLHDRVVSECAGFRRGSPPCTDIVLGPSGFFGGSSGSLIRTPAASFSRRGARWRGRRASDPPAARRACSDASV